MLVFAWNSLSIETIVNCFRKAGISPANQEAAIAEEDDPFKECIMCYEIDDLTRLMCYETFNQILYQRMSMHLC